MESISRGPEVVVVHVPRTAGIAFNGVLESVYGNENVEHDRSGQTPAARALRHDFDAWNRELRREVDGRTAWPKVVTGHFPLSKYERFLDTAFKILWLREPAARLLSAYFYMRSRQFTPGVDARGFGRDIPPERIDDVEWPSNPVSDWFIRGYGLDDFDFVGIQEHFAEDVAELGDMLRWPAVEIPVHNRTTTSEYLSFRPSEELLGKIRSTNHRDVALYEQALERRRARMDERARLRTKATRS